MSRERRRGVIYRLRLGSALVLTALALISCGAIGRWTSADEFVQGLQCDMTEEEIAAHVETFRRLRLHDPADKDQLLLALRGDTQIRLELEDSRLRTYQVSWTTGLTMQRTDLKTNVCTGEKLVELHVVSTDPRHAGATVWLDGERVGELSSAGTEVLNVRLGTHTLQIEKAGFGVWRTELSYDSSSPGYDRFWIQPPTDP